MKRKIVFSLLFLWVFSTAVYAENDQQDHRATVLRVKGDAKILKHTTGAWQAAAKGNVVEAGDKILTQENSVVELAYDTKLQNIGRIEANTQAEFVSIEPTDIHLTDGSIFNILDGLESGQSYQITTPTAVAAVRGTHFDVEFDSDEKQMDVDVFKDKKPGLGTVDILPPGGGGVPFQITEGNGASFNTGDLQSGNVDTNPVSEEESENANEAVKDASELREDNAGSGQGQNSGNGKSENKEQSQGDFAIDIIKEVGVLHLLSPAATGQDAIDFLTSLGIIPEGGWNANTVITDDFLRSFFGPEGEGLTREELLAKLVELVKTALGEVPDSTVSPGGNGASG